MQGRHPQLTCESIRGIDLWKLNPVKYTEYGVPCTGSRVAQQFLQAKLTRKATALNG